MLNYPQCITFCWTNQNTHIPLETICNCKFHFHSLFRLHTKFRMLLLHSENSLAQYQQRRDMKPWKYVYTLESLFVLPQYIWQINVIKWKIAENSLFNISKVAPREALCLLVWPQGEMTKSQCLFPLKYIWL